MKKPFNVEGVTQYTFKLSLKMKLTVLLTVVSLLQIHANSYSQSKKISLDMGNVTVEEVLAEIESVSEFKFLFNRKDVDLDRKVSIKVNKKPITDILTELFSGTDVGFEVLDKQIILSKSIKKKVPKNTLGSTKINIKPQQFSISGIVTDENGQPLPGANIVEKGTTNGVIADFDGNFSIDVADGNATLVISYIGFATKEVSVNGQTTINVPLAESAAALDEIVVVGYGTVKKSDLTGAISSVSSSQIAEVKATSLGQALAGRMAGVDVKTTTGEPGSPPQIKIRGVSSISASSEPLYIVDGFPVITIQSINPNDIESVDVLKDASATAIYGSRGSNGVVIITTKRGKTGDAVITLDTYYGFQKITKIPKMQTAEEQAQHYFEGVKNKNLDAGRSIAGNPNDWYYAVPYTVTEILDGTPLTQPGTTREYGDRLLEVIQVAPQSAINLSVSGGNENARYAISGEYLTQDGILRNTDYKRYSMRANVDLKLTDRLNLKMNFNPSYAIKHNIGNSSLGGFNSPGASTGSAIYNAMVIPEYYSLHNPDGSYFSFGSGLDAVVGSQNPGALVDPDIINNYQRQLFLLANVNLDYKITNDLKFNFLLGTNLAVQKGMSFRPQLPVFENNPAVGSDNASLMTNWLTEYTLNYNKSFGEHFLTGLGGFTVQKQQLYTNEMTSQSYPNNLVPALSATSGLISYGSSNESTWSLISYLARLNYNYAGKYFLTGSIRTDGSSRFGMNNKWGVFPSGAAAWRVSQEDFLKDANLISELKLRGSWGKTGNNNIGDYQSIATVNYLKYALADGPVGAYAPGRPANNNLTWETQVQTDFGIDLGLFNNRLNLSFDYSVTVNEDLLLDVNVAQVTGYSQALLNIGQVNNSGFDLTLSSTNVKGEFEWTTDFNISQYKNKVKKLGPEGDPIISGGHITQIGSPIGMFYGWIKDGIFMNQEELNAGPIYNPGSALESRAGDIRFKDISGPDGVPDGIITNDDRTIMGSPYPDFYYGMTNHFSYRNFSLSVSLQGSQGNEILQLSRNQVANNRARFKQLSIMNNYWKSEAEPGDGQTPRPNDTPTGNWRGQYSTQWLDNGSYLRINNISLGFMVPENICNMLSIKSARLYLNSTNPFTFTKYLLFNPDVNYSGSALRPGEESYDFPIAKSIIYGMKITF